MSVEILQPGPLALIQDAGRPGFGGVGVSPSGAFDLAAFAAASRLVGNDPGRHAGLELLLGGLVARLRAPLVLAATGAVCPISVDGHAVPWARALRVEPGQVLILGRPSFGLRSYLAVAGGLAVPQVLGSRSTDVLSGLGPAPLRTGDLLPVGQATGTPSPPAVPALASSARSPFDPAEGASSAVLELLPGPRTDWLADPSALATTWLVSPDSNRIGVRLSGASVRRAGVRAGTELASEPLLRGAVQLPPSGMPVIFGPDHPTTGGYPVVAVLDAASNDRLAQLRPGDSVGMRWRE